MSYENFSLAPARKLLESLFPETIEVQAADHQKITARRRISLSATEKSIVPCLSLVKGNLGSLYLRHKGSKWIDDKIVEMLEDELVYVSYRLPETKETVAFTSFVLTIDDCDGMVLYLYEIHVSPTYHGQKIGSLLIDAFHRLAQSLHDGAVDLEDGDATEIKATKLTVFPENKALDWYRTLGYYLSHDSPKDRTLRGGKLIKPDYYMLIRPVSQSQ